MMKLASRVTIDRLGAQGDGITTLEGRDLFIPYCLPGERVDIMQDGATGEVLSLVEASPERRTPPCAFFGQCGGCVLQQASPTLYRNWKEKNLRDTLQQAGLSCIPEPLQEAHGDGRRRVTLHGRRVSGAWQIGFMARRSHRLVAISTCLLLVPALSNAPQIAKTLAEALGGDKPLDIQLTATDGGVDADLRGHGPISDSKRRVLASTAQHLGLARLTLHHDLILEHITPQITMGPATVIPPAGGFLQATQAGEEALSRLVTEAATRSKNIADLFAGVGTFSLRLAQSAKVHAVESDARALHALDRAARTTPHLKPVSCEERDLFKRPLQPAELNRFDTVVFDPPRAGAQAQVEQLAKSEVKTVIAVSCNAASFARDAKILIEGGYTLQKIWPVDQFLYSAHIELVALFQKSKTAHKPRRLFG